MSYWDSSALVKLYVQELDSAEFRELAVKASRVATGSLTRHEVRTVFRRREAEGVLPSGEAAALYDELTADIAVADIRTFTKPGLIRFHYFSSVDSLSYVVSKTF